MEAALPWLSQGDVFTSIPLADDVAPLDELQRGPALLLTHDCMLDKTTNAGEPRIKLLQFARLLDVAARQRDQQDLIRTDSTRLRGAFYVGDVGGWEAFADLTTVFPLSADLFEVRVDDFEGHAAADPVRPLHLVAGRHGDRLGTIGRDRIPMLYQQMAVHWMGGTLSEILPPQ